MRLRINAFEQTAFSRRTNHVLHEKRPPRVEGIRLSHYSRTEGCEKEYRYRRGVLGILFFHDGQSSGARRWRHGRKLPRARGRDGITSLCVGLFCVKHLSQSIGDNCKLSGLYFRARSVNLIILHCLFSYER